MEFRFRKSSRSGSAGGNCVEVGTGVPGRVALRDSKDHTGPVLVFEVETFRDFLAAVKRGEMDR
jgi:hypothetical protein